MLHFAVPWRAVQDTLANKAEAQRRLDRAAAMAAEKAVLDGQLATLMARRQVRGKWDRGGEAGGEESTANEIDAIRASDLPLALWGGHGRGTGHQPLLWPRPTASPGPGE